MPDKDECGNNPEEIANLNKVFKESKRGTKPVAIEGKIEKHQNAVLVYDNPEEGQIIMVNYDEKTNDCTLRCIATSPEKKASLEAIANNLFFEQELMDEEEMKRIYDELEDKNRKVYNEAARKKNSEMGAKIPKKKKVNRTKH